MDPKTFPPSFLCIFKKAKLKIPFMRGGRLEVILSLAQGDFDLILNPFWRNPEPPS